MDLNVKSNARTLYCLDNHFKLNQILKNMTIPNGLDWSTDHQKMYYIDTSTYKVVQFDYNIDTAQIKNPTNLIVVPEKHGVPDGMCINSEGMLCIAHLGGSNVSQWNSVNGELLLQIDVTAPNVTSCCFGGENLETLYVATARTGLSEEQLEESPQSG